MLLLTSMKNHKREICDKWMSKTEELSQHFTLTNTCFNYLLEALIEYIEQDIKNFIGWTPDQFKHNTKVLEKIDDALEAIETTDVEGITTALKKGKQLLETRIKHLRIADAYGWLTVKEFKANELTSGEAEEKRLKRAIKNAEIVKGRFYKKQKLSDDSDYNKVLSLFEYSITFVSRIFNKITFIVINK
ncbi:uncharacterized protein [Clytia hemisphaerica]|uniref:uncharacterized protein isoform X2 n=1 Tax=Clytia hemisphaerica TaxID=252671 RepID=UPI0034D70DC7